MGSGTWQAGRWCAPATAPRSCSCAVRSPRGDATGSWAARRAMRGEPEVGIPARRKGANGASSSPVQTGEAFPLYRVLQEDGSADPDEVALPDGDLVALYRWMVLNRQLDERMIAMQRQGRINFYIGSIGEEATVFGTVRAMEPTDWVFPCYREHGAALLRGMPLEKYVCDLLGNAGDAMLGHQMPCHEAWRPALFTSISSPIATQIPHAVGAAWAARIKGDEMVSLVYFGEGATSANDFHTGLNFAAVNKVPVVFACRNKGWAIGGPRGRRTASETIARRRSPTGCAASAWTGTISSPCTPPRAARASAPRTGTARRSSSASRTASRVTRRPTIRARTGHRRWSSPGARRTPSCA